MEFEYWWLLVLPLFFAFGWFAHGRERSDRSQARSSAAASVPVEYLKGINLLLEERPDAAIDAFTDVARIAPEAVDLHFALGALFRRRGETDRAIRVHRNLMERGGLGDEERDRARFALGEDYLKAGLIDRAEAAFNELAGTALGPAADRQRLEIARMTRDWPRVIELAQGLPDGDPDKTLIRLHAHSEVAEAALDAGRLDEAAAEIDAASLAVPDHPRLLIAQARLEWLRGHAQASLATHERLAQMHPDSLPLHAGDWLDRARRTGSAPVLGLAMARIEAVPAALASPDVLRPVALARAQADSPAEAIDWLDARLAEHPSLLGMQTLLELLGRQAEALQQAVLQQAATQQAATRHAADQQAADQHAADQQPNPRQMVTDIASSSGGVAIAQAVPTSEALRGVKAEVPAKETLDDERAMLEGLVKRQAEHQSRFVCSHCGFRARRHYWQCPGCARWDTYPATRQE